LNKEKQIHLVTYFAVNEIYSKYLSKTK